MPESNSNPLVSVAVWPQASLHKHSLGGFAVNMPPPRNRGTGSTNPSVDERLGGVSDERHQCVTVVCIEQVRRGAELDAVW